MIPRIREVHIRNYKSISQAVVQLSDLTLLVGPNGSGKSNLADVFAFVQECLSASLEQALMMRRWIGSVRHRSAGAEEPLGLRLIIDLDEQTAADYSFELANEDHRTFRVEKERCVVTHQDGSTHRFEVHNGAFVEEIKGIRSQMEAGRLALYAASATPEFRPVYDFLTGIQSYRIEPDSLGSAIEPAPGPFLDSDGRNAAGILQDIQRQSPDRYKRIMHLLRIVVPGIDGVEYVTYGPLEALHFIENGQSVRAEAASEGTRRFLGLLLAAYQPHTPSMLVLEEPETAIHPGAAEVVMSVLLDAAKRTQVLVTTHSPDILDDKVVTDEMIRVVAKIDGRSMIASVAESSRQAVRKRLYSPGELLRSDELRADVSSPPRIANLFGPPASALGEAA